MALNQFKNSVKICVFFCGNLWEPFKKIENHLFGILNFKS